MIILYSSIVLVITFLISVAFRNIKAKSIKERQYKEFVSVFMQTPTSAPLLEFGSHYGWPTFTVKFANKEDYDHAKQNHLFELFNKKIEAFYDGKFKSSMAVTYEYSTQD